MSCIASALAMQLSEPGRWHAAATAVRSDLVVVLPPGGDGGPGLLQRPEPLLVQALVAELAVEALDVAVLHGSPRLDQDMPDAMCLRPAHEGAAGELGAVVGAHRQRVAAKEGSLVEQPGDVLARDAPIHRDAHTFMTEVVGHRQALDAPACR